MNNNNNNKQLRNTLKLKYNYAYSFNKIVKYIDLPSYFDQRNKFWWRWYCDIYGFFYDRVKKSYSIWFTNYLKKNIGIYKSFIFSDVKYNKWKKSVFLYENSLIKKSGFVQSEKINFWLINYISLSNIAKDIILTGNRIHRPINSYGYAGLEINMFISSYNAKWNNLYNESSLFYNTGRMPNDFFIMINSYFINSNYIINSFDSHLTLYPQKFLEKLKIKNNKFLILLDYFLNKINLIYYYNVLILIYKLYVKFILFKLIKYINFFFNKYEFNLYKLNSYLYFIKYLIKYYNIYFAVNYYTLYLIFFNKYNLNKIIQINNIKLKIKYDFNILYYLYISNIINYKFNWLYEFKNKNLIKYNFLWKFVNKFSLYDLKFLKNNIDIKKIYITEWLYLWDLLINQDIFFNKMKKKKQSLYFIKQYKNLFLKKYNRLKDFYDIVEFFNNLKNKYVLNLTKTYSIIKPSIKMYKVGYIIKLNWITKFGKHFFKAPQNRKNLKFFFINNYNKFRFILYYKYSSNFLQKIKNFIYNFSLILIIYSKINFGFSFKMLNKDVNIISLNENRYNIQSYIYLYFCLIKKYFNSYPIKFKDNLYKIFSIYKLKIFHNNKKNKNIIYKGIKLNYLGYLKFILND